MKTQKTCVNDLYYSKNQSTNICWSATSAKILDIYLAIAECNLTKMTIKTNKVTVNNREIINVQRERALVAPNDKNNRIAGYMIDSGTSN